MAGILANSVSKTMLDGDTSATNAVSGYVVEERITLSITPSGTTFQWGEAFPSGSAPTRSELSDESTASPSFVPDVAGEYVITVVADSVTTYVLRITVVDSSPVSIVGGIGLPSVADASIPAPPVGLTFYNSSEHSGLATKNPSGVVSVIGGGGGSGTVTGPSSSISQRLPRFFGTSGAILDQSLAYVDNSGNFSTPGTVQGRDVSSDGNKLDGISSGADVTLTALAAAASAVSVNGQKVTNLGAPSASTDAATKLYVDSTAQGLNVKDSCIAASTTNITLSGIPQTIDGVSISADGQRVAVLGQTNGVNNGIYVAHSGAWTRSPDLAAGAAAGGAFTFIQQGTTYGGTGWVCRNTSPTDVVGTDSLTFTQFSGGGSVTVDSTLTQNGNQLGVNQATATPQAPGTAAVGTSDKSSREDHVHAPPTSAQVITAIGSAGSSVSVNSQNITSLADPVNPTDAATKQYVDGLAAPKYTDTFTSTSATSLVVRNISLTDNAITRIVVFTTARDTGPNWYKKKSSTEWTRSSGGSVVQLGIEDGPVAKDNIGVTGMSIVANGSGVDIKYGGSGSVHTGGVTETFVETILVDAAT